MRIERHRAAAYILVAGLGLLAGSVPATAATGKIGVTAAVNPDAEGTPPDAAKRVLYVGIDMQTDERVTTSDNGRAQLLFLDGSAMSVGPNSDILLDRFVYDPDTDTGDLAVTVGRGVFRFVGGRISKREAVTISTGTATIGIRGGITTVAVGQDGNVQSNFLFGDRMTVTSGGETQSTDMPGTAIEVTAGQPPRPPRVLTRGEVTATLSAFNARPPAGDDAQAAAGEGQGGNPGDTTQQGQQADGSPPAAADAQADGSQTDDSQAGDAATDAAGQTTDPSSAAQTAADSATGTTTETQTSVAGASGGNTPDGGASADPDAALVSSGVSGSTSSEQPSGVVAVTPETRQPGAAAGPAPTATESGQAADGAGSRTVADASAESRSGDLSDAITDLDRIQEEEAEAGQTVAEGENAEQQPGAASQSASGRLLRDPVYDSFDPQSLSVRFLGEDTPMLRSASVAADRLQVQTVTGETYDFPYRPTGSEYAVSDATATGPFDTFGARMYVAPDGSFWRVSGDSDASASGGEFILFGGTPTTLAQIPASGTTAYAIGGLLEPLPFVGGTLPFDSQTAGVAISAFYLRHGPGITFSQRQSGAAPPLGYQTSLVISGEGAAQTSFMAGAVATIVEEGAVGSGVPALSGRMRGSYMQSANQAPVALRASLASAGVGDRSAVYGDSGQYMVLNPSSLSMDPQTGRVTRQTAGMLARRLDGSATSSDQYFVLATQPGGATPPDFALSRTGRSLKGFTGGTGFTGSNGETSGMVFVDGSIDDTPGGVSIRTDSASGQVSATVAVADVLSGSPRILFFGGEEAATWAQPSSAFVDNDRYIALESVSDRALVGAGQTARSQDLVLVTATSIEPAALGLQPCQCAFLDWGFWSGALSLQDNSEERFHMASWVAGELPALADIPASGTATYGGHIVGSVFNNGANYIAAGQMGANWDFAQRSGGFEVTGFDAMDYAGEISSQDGLAIAGAAQSADQSRQMAVNGAFFAGGGNPVAAMGGHFIVQNGNQSYVGGGSWAMDQQP